MGKLTVTSKGQITLRKDLLRHLGIHPGEQVSVDKLPDGRIEVRAAKPTGDISDVFNFTQDQTKKPEALHPTQVRASSAAPGHRAGAAFDGFNNRYWAPASTGPGTGQYLEADFDKPVRLQKLLITPGISANEGEFLTQARPAKITITMVNSKGKETTKSISLHDQPGGQPFDVKAADLARVRLTTDASFGARANRRLAIAEIELFGRR